VHAGGGRVLGFSYFLCDPAEEEPSYVCIIVPYRMAADGTWSGIYLPTIGKYVHRHLSSGQSLSLISMLILFCNPS
jgi:hypothetical protein